MAHTHKNFFKKIKQKQLNLTHQEECREHSIEKTGEKLRAMMPWIKANRLVDKSKN